MNAKTVRVILADDHVVVRAGIRQFLENSPGIRVIAEAGNGREACTLVEQHHPDVVIMDIQMPVMSGIDATRALRGEHNPVGILILTAFDDEPYVRAVLQAGANGFVLKTAQPEEIIRAVWDVYQGKSVLDSNLTRRMVQNLFQKPESAPVEDLTSREVEILTLAGRGLTNKAIAVQLGISDRTVQNHLANIFSKLNAASRTEAVMRAVSLGIIPANLAETPLDNS